MAIDDKMEDFAERLDRRIASHRDQQERDREELAAAYRRADAEQQARVQAQRAVASDRQLAWRPPAPAEAITPPPHARIALWQTETLQRLDRLMWTAFNLDRPFPGQPLGRYPVVYCETLKEFFAPILAEEDLSEVAQAEALQELVAEAERGASEAGGGVFGVNLPGQGCYVNGWLFGVANGISAREALQDPQVFTHILGIVCHEKLGHGFFAELTAAGQEKTRLGLWRFDLARKFSLRTVDSPRGALLRQKGAHLHHVTQITEEGWATWIESYMLWRAARDRLLARSEVPAEPGVRYTLEQVWEVLRTVRKRAPDLRPTVKRLSDAVEMLLVGERDASAGTMLGAVRVWQVEAPLLDGAFAQALGQPAVYVLGYLLLRRLEAQLGWRNLPCAIAIAANVTYDLEEIPLADMAALATQDPRLNVDARLALLATLELAPGQGPADLARQAREALSLAVPEGWQ